MHSIVPKSNRIREGSRLADGLIYLIAAVSALVTLYPIYYVLILSLSEPFYAATMRVYWWPKGFFLGGYAEIFQDSRLWLSYRNTLVYASSQTLLMLFTCSTAAYALSSKHLAGRRLVNAFLLIPMYFSGGVIPSFLLILQLGLYNTPWALILPGSFSIWYIILVKAYFGTIPESLREASHIDGANSYQTLCQVYLPTSKPILAVIALYTVVGVWNSWYAPALYISSQQWQPLQLYLRRILVEQTVDLSQDLLSAEQLMAEQQDRLSNNQLKYTVIVVSSLPMLVAYPFFQQYFVKGVMLGSLKE
ncbi:MAG TPA: carbohydrate ABC transporter permease [Clostridia bacterium]|nr:carbohydrate ABC transporter permease [Clostridia bacterium]